MIFDFYNLFLSADTKKGQWDTTLTTAYGCESYCTF